MRRYVLALLALACSVLIPAAANASCRGEVGGTNYDAPACTGVSGYLHSGVPQPVDDDTHPLPVTVTSGGGSNASVGTTGSAVPTGATLTGYKDGSNNLQPDAPATPHPTTPYDSGGTSMTDTTNHAQYVSPIVPSTKVKGIGTATGTSATQILAAVTSKVIYVLYVSCQNSGSTDSDVSIQDGSGGTVLAHLQVKAGGGNNLNAGGFPVTWTTSGNGLYFANASSTTSMVCQASGFSG